MKNLIFTISFLFTISIVIAQNKERINDIEQKCRIIDLTAGYKTIELDGSEFLDTVFINQAGEGYGKLFGYFKNDTLYKIREFYGIRKLEIIGITEYYYWDDKLIFVRETENNGPDVFIDTDGTIDYRIKIPEYEGLFYFFYEMLIYKLIEGEQIILPNEKYFDSQSKEGQLLTSSEKNKLLIKKSKF